MLLRLEFAEKKSDLEPALETFHEAVNGEYVYIIQQHYICWLCGLL